MMMCSLFLTYSRVGWWFGVFRCFSPQQAQLYWKIRLFTTLQLFQAEKHKQTRKNFLGHGDTPAKVLKVNEKSLDFTLNQWEFCK